MAPSPKSSSVPPLTPAPDAGSPAPEEVELGTIAGVFGLAGEVRLHLHHRESDYLFRRRDVVLVDKQGKRWISRLKARTGAGRRVVAQIEGVDTIEQAESLLDWRVLVPRSRLPATAEDEFYITDVVGNPAFVNGEPVGKVVAVHTTSHVEVLELEIDGKLAYVPCLREHIVRIGPDGVHLTAEAIVREEE